MRNPTAQAYVMLGAAQLAVGAAAIFARFALAGAQPIAVSAMRLLVATLFLSALAALRKSSTGKPTGRELFTLLAAGVMLAIHFAGWIWSLQYIGVAVSTLLVTTTPLFTTLFDAIVLRKRFAARVWLAYLGGAIGLVFVVGLGGGAAPISGHAAAGIVLALLGAVAIGAYFILVREVRTQLSTRTIVTTTYSSAAIVLCVAMFLMHQTPPATSNYTAWLGILAMALISQLLGHTALNAALRWFSPSAVAMSTLLEPVFAAILAAFIFSERIGFGAIAGAIILLVAIGVVLHSESAVPTPEL